MPSLSRTQRANFLAALVEAPTPALRVRLAFAIWTESRGLIYANDGTNKSNSPGFDRNPQWSQILRRSLDLPHNAVGSNGRSTGMLQQISSDVGGAWGDMAGTMNPSISAQRFLERLVVTDNPVFSGILLTPNGSQRVEILLSSPIAADVLRVQQPLADEARSANYGEDQVRAAQEIVNEIATGEQSAWLASFLKRSNP